MCMISPDMSPDIIGQRPTGDSIDNSKSFWEELLRPDGTAEDEAYYEKYGKYDPNNGDKGDTE